MSALINVLAIALRMNMHLGTVQGMENKYTNYTSISLNPGIALENPKETR
ncbi:hypothetical protein KC19_VG216100 [Ceratodon purpureus]|uniref:Uncharacterized protein n=1 Tax=Ceratodon purpureus TaxID=3225 RepID=A0A8T0HSC7_CERPU|nr:hypothetical protein KC19_VG216100 [Ceratodon purpureus]